MGKSKSKKSAIKAKLSEKLTEGYLMLPTTKVKRVSRTRSATEVFGVIGEKKDLFYQAGKVVRLTDGRLTEVQPETFAELIERYGTPGAYAIKKDDGGKGKGTLEVVPTNCSIDQARALLASPQASELLPNIQLITRSPVVYVHDSELHLTEAGWNDASGGLYQFGAVDCPCVDLGEAVAILGELLVDFDFTTPADRSRFLAFLLTPALTMGGLIGGPIPMLVCEADQSQSGKSYSQKVIAAIYGERVNIITQKSGGVGSFDESFSEALATGRPFIQLDNFRGKINSKVIEAIMTADGPCDVRVLHRNVTVDPRGKSLMLSSNGFTSTKDLANRSLMVRIKKREGHEWRAFKEGDLLDHIWANQGRYLGAIFTVVAHWWEQGKPTTSETRHDFRSWCRVLDWICQNLLKEAPIMEGHRELQTRQSVEGLGLLRQLAIAVDQCGSLGEELSASDLVDIGRTAGVEIKGGDKPQSWIGRMIGPVFREADTVTVEGFGVERIIDLVDRADGKGQDPCKLYIFTGPKK